MIDINFKFSKIFYDFYAQPFFFFKGFFLLKTSSWAFVSIGFFELKFGF